MMRRRRPMMGAAMIGGRRRRRRRRIIAGAAIAGAARRNREEQRYHQNVQEQQIRDQQYEIEKLKAQQNAAAPQIVYVQAPPAGQAVATAAAVQHVQPQPVQPQVQYVVQTQAAPPTQPSAPPLNIQYVHSPDGPTANTGVASAAALSAAAYNPAVQPLVTQTAPQHIQTVQAGQLTTEQQTYVQPQPQPQTKIVYVEKPVEKIVYVEREAEAETLIEKPQKEEPPPPEQGGCCCLVM